MCLNTESKLNEKFAELIGQKVEKRETLIGVDFDNTLVRLSYNADHRALYQDKLEKLNQKTSVGLRTLWKDSPNLRATLHQMLTDLEKTCTVAYVNAGLFDLLSRYFFVIVSDNGQEVIHRVVSRLSIAGLRGVYAREPLYDLKPDRLDDIYSKLSLYIGNSEVDRAYAENLNIPFLCI